MTAKIILSFLCLPFLVVSQTYDSKINDVTVFMQGAQIQRTANLKLEKGISTISLKGLSRYIDANSIQTKIKGVKILNVSYKLDYLSDEEQNLDKKKLEIALEDLDYKLKTIHNKKLSTEQELKLIQQNVDIKGQAVLDVADLEDFLIFYRSNLPLIRTSILNLEVEHKQVTEQIQKVKQELRELNSSQQKVSGTIDVEISSDKAGIENLEMTYFVRNAGWSPFYNLRTKGVNEAIEMEFNANVYQNTGVEWKNVNITLATGNPQVNGNAPQLYNWYVDYYQEKQMYKLKTPQVRGNVPMESAKKAEILYEDDMANYEPAIQSENLTFQEYKISSPYNISSNGKQQRVEIQKHQLPAEYNYFAVPKLDSKAYLVAKVANWEQYKLLSGNSKIYFEDTYVGEAYIDANNTADTLTLSLGEDKNVVIERKSIVDKSNTKFIGQKETKNKSFEINIRNAKSKSIKIEILDQIPLSKNNEIKVKLNESADAVYNEQTGELKWIVEVNSNEKVTKTFDFEISYPKNKKIRF